MTERPRQLLAEIAQLASDLGPALAPAGHEALLESITSVARNIFGAAACSVALLDEATEELVFYVASGAGASDVTGMRIPANHGIAGYVLMSGQPIAIQDVRTDPRFASDVAETTGYVPRSILAMPLDTDHATIGVISVLDRTSSEARDMELLALFARQAALAIENSRVFADLGRTLLSSLRAATDDQDLQELLESAETSTQGPNPELRDFIAQMRALVELGTEERRAATALLRDFLEYVRRRQRWT